MKKFVLTGTDGLSSLVAQETSIPEPGAGQVVVRLRAISLNFRDIMIAGGSYAGIRYPLVPISDGSGVVEAVGPGVTKVKSGDKVCGIFMQDWLAGSYRAEYGASSLGGQTDGMLCEYVLLSQDGVIPFPAHLSFEEAATLPCAAVTAWNALFERSKLSPGERVLVQGTGGVSIFALQFAKAAGAEVLITSSSDEKLEKAKAMGAAATVQYRKFPEWQDEILKLTANHGVEHVVEVGGAGTFERSMKAVCPGGTVSVIGILTGVGTNVPLIDFIRKVVHVQGIYVGSRAMFERMNRLIDSAKLRPVIDKVFPLSQIREAYQYQIDGKHFGKVVVSFDL